MMTAMTLAFALFVVCLSGWAAGSLLGEWRDTFSAAVIRTICGLLLTTIAFLLSLLLSVPWFVGPAAVLAVALAWKRTAAWSVPRVRPRLTWTGALTALVTAIILSPILVATIRMTPGPFPPVFFSVDSPYSLEKAQALARTETYPPESLSNLGGTRTYHYATQGMAALISRVTGLPPHQALFGLVVPLLVGGMAAAAAATAQELAPRVPPWAAVPLLLATVPSFWYPMWGDLLLRVPVALSSGVDIALDGLFDNYETWGVATVEAHNVGAQFVVLASLAGIAAAARRGWSLPVFLIGTAIIVKTSAGVALVSGSALAAAACIVWSRRPMCWAPLAGLVAVFAATYLAFFVAPGIPADFETQIFPLFHLGTVTQRAGLVGMVGLGLDLAWVVLPAIVVWAAVRRMPSPATIGWLLFGLAPFIVVNTTRAADIREGGGGSTDDWIQVLVTVPIVLHAFVLAFASEQWERLRAWGRPAFIAVLLLTILPLTWVAGSYTRVLVEKPEDGHEYVDNRSIAEALRHIPRDGTVVVTNDLRYPANGFRRTNRQMQIPALYGHQAFAVNYRYERYAFSEERAGLQKQLEAGEWTSALHDAARAHGWTHLLIRKDFPHPARIPLEQVFENAQYAVYRWKR